MSTAAVPPAQSAGTPASTGAHAAQPAGNGGGTGTGIDLSRPKGRRALVDQVMRGLVWLAAVIAIIPLVWILATVLGKGVPVMFTSQPDYTRICAVSATAPSPDYDSYKRVANGDCNGGDGNYRWIPGGSYPAVGSFLSSTTDSVSRDPGARNPNYVIGIPNSDGAGTIRTPSTQWWTQDAGAVPDNKVGGGVKHALIGSLWVTAIATLIAVPLGVLGAYYLVEYARGRRAAKVVSFMVDILTGVPSIVAALFIYAVLITILGLQRSAFASALALVLLMLPTVLRSTEEMLKLVPDSLREASYALGVPKWKTITSVVTPTAFGGIATGIVLGIARVMGETAPLLILLNYARNTNWNPFGNTMGTLPTMIAGAAALPEDYPGTDRGWGAAATLILLVMALNLVARWIARRGRLQEK